MYFDYVPRQVDVAEKHTQTVCLPYFSHTIPPPFSANHPPP